MYKYPPPPPLSRSFSHPVNVKVDTTVLFFSAPILLHLRSQSFDLNPSISILRSQFFDLNSSISILRSQSFDLNPIFHLLLLLFKPHFSFRCSVNINITIATHQQQHNRTTTRWGPPSSTRSGWSPRTQSKSSLPRNLSFVTSYGAARGKVSQQTTAMKSSLRCLFRSSHRLQTPC